MSMHIIGRLAGALAMTIGLAGCIDMTMEMEIQSETNGKATVTSTMGPDVYPMVKANAGNETADSEGFCDKEKGVLTENPDGGATCVEVTEGTFAELTEGEDDGATFTVVSPGLVRVAFKTEDMKGDLAASTGGGDEAMDDETKAMMAQFFEGHTLTIRIKGKEVTDTNMTLSADKTGAETVIPFLDLINGTVELPDELYAVVKVN